MSSARVASLPSTRPVPPSPHPSPPRSFFAADAMGSLASTTPVSLSAPRPAPAPSPWPARTINYLAATKYPTIVPMHVQIVPGFWSDGKDYVLSAAHPAVRALLADARATLRLPPTSSDVIFTLAALDVFYFPGDPAHWLFWSDEKKLQTAKIVNRISLHQPPLIKSNVAWNGIPEYLSILATRHGAAFRPLYEAKPWYQIIVPPKETAASKVINLRKRKAAPGAFREPSRTPDLDIEPEPRPKRAKTQRATSPEKKAAAQPAKTAALASPPTAAKSPASPALSVSLPPLADLVILVTPPSATTPLHPDLAAEDRPSPRTSARTRRRVAPSRYPASVCSRESSSTPPESLLLATEPPPALSTHSRNRSTSQTSSETSIETLVPSDEGGRSASIASDSTAVGTSKGKKHKLSDVEEEPPSKGSEDSDTKSEVSADSNEGMSTRGRSQRARSADSIAAKLTDASITKPNPPSRTKAKAATGSRAKTKRTSNKV